MEITFKSQYFAKRDRIFQGPQERVHKGEIFNTKFCFYIQKYRWTSGGSDSNMECTPTEGKTGLIWIDRQNHILCVDVIR